MTAPQLLASPAGKRPRWLQEALQGGAELSDFAVGEAA